LATPTPVRISNLPYSPQSPVQHRAAVWTGRQTGWRPSGSGSLVCCARSISWHRSACRRPTYLGSPIAGPPGDRRHRSEVVRALSCCRPSLRLRRRPHATAQHTHSTAQLPVLWLVAADSSSSQEPAGSSGWLPALAAHGCRWAAAPPRPGALAFASTCLLQPCSLLAGWLAAVTDCGHATASACHHACHRINQTGAPAPTTQRMCSQPPTTATRIPRRSAH
jgi:hypothetical protein